MFELQLNLSHKPGYTDTFSGPAGAGRALLIVEAAARFDGLTLVLTGSAREGLRLVKALEFFSSGSELDILQFPDRETLPYDIFSPHADIISERLRTLALLPHTRRGVLVVPVPTAMHRLPPPEFVASRSFSYRVGDQFDRQQLQAQLEKAGYRRVETVCEHGEYAFRGSVIDLFPSGSQQPFRIDLLDDEIESLRLFDPDSQRSLGKVEKIQLLPAREFPLDRDAINRFLNNWLLKFDGRCENSSVYQAVRDGTTPQGIEYYTPLFFGSTASLFDYLPEPVQLVTDGNTQQAATSFRADVEARYREYGVDPARPLLPPDDIVMPVDNLFGHFKRMPRIHLTTEQAPQKPHDNSNSRPHTLNLLQVPEVAVDDSKENPLGALQNFLQNSNCRTLLCAESAGRREILLDLLNAAGLKPSPAENWKKFLAGTERLAITTNPIDEGVFCPQHELCLITEGELFGKKVLQRRRRSSAAEAPEQVFKSLAELQINAPVVHIEHGVGRYQGLTTLEVDKAAQEFLILGYANDARLYVPVSSLHLISRFSGSDPDLAPLHTLGSEKWKKDKQKAANQVRDSAAELLDIYARRAARKGFACRDEEAEYRRFCAEFPFEETADQLTAIDAVRADLLSDKPMDRLVCGDVGFGKTEVAMRAAFSVVTSGKQVVVLVPTTLLAQQHLENFRDRFANWPVRVDVLSRFRSAKEQQQVLDAVQDGRIDILISTHKLLHTEIRYARLGLLIVDEEHRFGVRQKEKLKSLRSEVDILALTATPIPRTLNLAMHGMRDLSIIASPPARRLSVKTFVRSYENRVVREAVLREVLRGGQAYYLHNDVASIQRAAEDLRQLVPEARVEIAHGQMRERQLEKVMSDFYHQRFNVLVCTTIIETGIDIPSANTIVIRRADKFGLAQLHQLRGRVGRSHHQAYAYLLTPVENAITPDAEKRLAAIAAAEHLGSGFTLATHDLEIRGAGELLGEEQSGHIQAIGFALYMEMLDRAVEALRRGKPIHLETALDDGIEVNMHVPALIPADYLPDVNMRLTLYKRLADCRTAGQLRELQVEMIDRFGLLPEPVKSLFQVTELRQTGEKLGLKKIEANSGGGRLQFSETTSVEPMVLVSLVQSDPKRYRLQSGDQLGFTMDLQNIETRFAEIDALLRKLLPTSA